MKAITCSVVIVLWVLFGRVASAQQTVPASGPATAPAAATQHPALFLVGDSIMNTGSGTGQTGPWGWGAEIIPLFDAKKIHVYNEGRGGRSSRGYIEEGLWGKVLERMQAGDFVVIQFGHNDSANSTNYPDRISLKGNGDDTQEITSPAGKKETIHSYGWYLRAVGGRRGEGERCGLR
jgi:hypothetical protein